MNPGLGVNPTRSATSLLFLSLHLSTAELTGKAGGNVGCLFSDIVCTSNEVCFNDLVIGRCISASSDNQHVERLGPLEGPSLGLLEAEMSRVFGLGYSWPDTYTQCVFQTLIYNIQHRLPYTQDQCGSFLTAQRLISQKDIVDLDDTDRDEDEDKLEEDVFLVPDIDDDNEDISGRPHYIPPAPEYSYLDPTMTRDNDDDDDITPDQQQEAWFELQNVLHNLQPREDPQPSEYFFLTDHDDQSLDGDKLMIDPYGQLVLVPLELEDGITDSLSPDVSSFLPQQALTDYYPPDIDANTIDNDNPYLVAEPDSVYVYDDNLINQPRPADFHPVEKREATYFQPIDDEVEESPTFEHPPSSYGYIVSSPEDVDYVLTPVRSDTADFDSFYPPDDSFLVKSVDETPEEELVDQEIWIPNEKHRQPRTNIRQRRADKNALMDSLYSDDAEENISDYDFEYADSTEDKNINDDDDILYYNPDNEPLEVESVFNRRERLDVKKPGPFYANSPNNFYLDKLPIDTMNDEEDMDDEDPGQTEYEFPLSAQEQRQKKGYQPSLLSYSEPLDKTNDYLYVNIKERFSSLGQAKKLWQYIADHLEVPTAVFSDFKPETSRIVLKVNSNPKQLNATSMAKILEADNALKEHTKNDLGVDIESFEVGDEKNTVMSIYSGPSKLFLLLFLLTAGIAALLLAAAVLLVLRRRTQDKAKKLQDESKIEKEEPVKEYKQLVRDWSRSSRASQGSGPPDQTAPGSGSGSDKSKGASPNKILGKTGQNSEGSRTSSTSSWQEEPGANGMDISTGHMVLSYMEDHLKNKQRLEQEWVGLCAYEAEPNCTSNAFKVENKKKNRYPDKLPYDHNRVLLNALVNGSNSDYINASSVMDHDPRNPAYIITQGPMTHTVADFWQMVWDQGSVVIVMLTKLSENGYQLCHRYWPEEGSEQYHIFEVHLVSEHVWCDDYMVRSLYLKNNQTGETRTVTQFHFLSWPDGNIPTSTKAILEFRRKVNKSYRGRSCPMIIHCSDGVGRSGTYVLIDMVLNRMMKGSKEIDIAATLEHIRDQRAGMVQTRSQFEFCLMAVAEETHAILKALPQ